MINAFVANKLPTLNDMYDNIGQISSVGGGSTLVENNLQLRLSLQERQHGLHKILAIFGIEPCCANDDMLHSCSLNELFAMQFRSPVDSCWLSLLRLLARNIIVCSAENIVGADVHQQSVNFFHCKCQIFGCLSIEHINNISGRFGCIDIGPCCTVDDALHIMRLHHLANSIKIGDV